MHRKIQSDDSESDNLEILKQDVLEELIVAEIVEVLVPVAYAIAVLIAYYGPNSTILGNIKNNYWSYTEIEDLDSLMYSLFKMFAIDLLSAVIGTVLLWKFCSINFLREVFRILKLYWPFMCIAVGGGVMKVCNTMSILLIGVISITI